MSSFKGINFIIFNFQMYSLLTMENFLSDLPSRNFFLYLIGVKDTYNLLIQNLIIAHFLVMKTTLEHLKRENYLIRGLTDCSYLKHMAITHTKHDFRNNLLWN